MSAEKPDTIVIDRRFHGPPNSGNGGYVCGRVARFIEGPATVRLRTPPPLDVEMHVHRDARGVSLLHRGVVVAQGWPSPLLLEIPDPPDAREAEQASQAFPGFKSHRFPSCFVCGPERAPGDGLRIFAGPVPGKHIVACTWTPAGGLAIENPDEVSSEFVWAALDCPGGFAFPEPREGTILLGELTVQRFGPLRPEERAIVIGWEIAREGRKHHTGTAIFSESGACRGAGRGIWLEVPEVRS